MAIMAACIMTAILDAISVGIAAVIGVRGLDGIEVATTGPTEGAIMIGMVVATTIIMDGMITNVVQRRNGRRTQCVSRGHSSTSI